MTLSPSLVTRSGSFRPLNANQLVGRGQHVSAIASGSVLNVSALRELLPLPAGLWLDYVDHWIFAQFHRRGFVIELLNCRVDHDLSIVSPAALTESRLVSVLEGEAKYYSVLGWVARAVYPWRIVWRITQMLFVNPRLARCAFLWAWSRVSSAYD